MEVSASCNPALYAPPASSYPVHPTLIDSLLQASIISTTSGRYSTLKGKIPVSIDMLTLDMNVTEIPTTVRARSTFGSQHTAVCQAELLNGDKQTLVINGLQIAPWLRRDFNHDLVPREPFLEKVWINEREVELQKNGLEMNGTRKNEWRACTATRAIGMIITLLSVDLPQRRGNSDSRFPGHSYGPNRHRIYRHVS